MPTCHNPSALATGSDGSLKQQFLYPCSGLFMLLFSTPEEPGRFSRFPCPYWAAPLPPTELRLARTPSSLLSPVFGSYTANAPDPVRPLNVGIRYFPPKPSAGCASKTKVVGVDGDTSREDCAKSESFEEFGDAYSLPRLNWVSAVDRTREQWFLEFPEWVFERLEQAVSVLGMSMGGLFGSVSRACILAKEALYASGSLRYVCGDCCCISRPGALSPQAVFDDSILNR